MIQSEYLRELRANLAALPPEDLADILTDYEGFFVSGREDGKTDDEISAELGSPAFLARTLLQEHESPADQPDNRIANPGKRLGAYVIDSIIAILPILILSSVIGGFRMSNVMLFTYQSPLIGALLYMSIPAYYGVSEATLSEIRDDGEVMAISRTQSRPAPVTAVLACAALAFYLLYSCACTLILRGQTIGKKIMRVKVRRTNAGPVTKGAIISREVLGKVFINSIPVIPIVSLFMLLFTKDHKTLHDMLADTIVSDV